MGASLVVFHFAVLGIADGFVEVGNAALGMLLIFGIVFVMLTFYPPNLPLFQPEGSIPGRIAAGNGT